MEKLPKFRGCDKRRRIREWQKTQAAARKKLAKQHGLDFAPGTPGHPALDENATDADCEERTVPLAQIACAKLQPDSLEISNLSLSEPLWQLNTLGAVYELDATLVDWVGSSTFVDEPSHQQMPVSTALGIVASESDTHTAVEELVAAMSAGGVNNKAEDKQPEDEQEKQERGLFVATSASIAARFASDAVRILTPPKGISGHVWSEAVKRLEQALNSLAPDDKEQNLCAEQVQREVALYLGWRVACEAFVSCSKLALPNHRQAMAAVIGTLVETEPFFLVESASRRRYHQKLPEPCGRSSASSVCAAFSQQGV